MEKWVVYVLYSRSFNRYYTGMCSNIERRLFEHNSGKTKSTKAFIPWEVIFTEVVSSRQDARIREKYWKSGAGREKIKEAL
jgi:putative endonuclease